MSTANDSNAFIHRVQLEFAGRPTLASIDDPLQLPGVLQQATLDYWQAPSSLGISRMAWFAAVLQQAAWTECQAAGADAALLRQVVVNPQRAQRGVIDGSALDAYLVETLWTDRLITRQRLADALLLSDGTQWLLCEIGRAPQAFTSRAQFELSWSARMAAQQADSVIEVRLHTITDDPFLAQAQVLLDNQLHALASLPWGDATANRALAATCLAITDPAPRFSGASALPYTTLAPLQAALPAWLQTAAPADQQRYRSHLLELAAVQQRAAGQGFADGIPTLEAYTRERLRHTMGEDFPLELRYEPSELLINFKVASGVPGGWGLVETHTLSLPQLAIANLAGAPRGQASISHAKGLYLQPGLTAEYCLRLVQRVDIGKHYPETLQQQLIGDPFEARRRQALYFDQLQVQLPLQALQLHIEGKQGFTAQGYQLVCAAMAHPGDTLAPGAVVQPLAFKAFAQASADAVLNAYLISATDASGPLVLYLPMSKRSLHQFSDVAALIAALGSDAQLEQSLLVWMSATGRRLYQRGGFAAPRLASTLDEHFIGPVPGPATLARVPIDDLPGRLYQGHVDALLALADSESTSNAESRWQIIKEGGWILFNVVQMAAQVLIWGGMLVLSPLVLAGWLAQVAQALPRDIEGAESPDPQRKIPAIIDLIMNLASLGLHGFQLLQGIATPPRPTLPAEVLDTSTRLAQQPWTQRPPTPEDRPGAGQLAALGRSLTLDYSASQITPQATLFEQLLALRAPRPEPLPPPLADGPLAGLYRIDSHYFAAVGAMFFRVRVSGEDVCIIDSRIDTRLGPWLKARDGRWTLDLKLRLRGGAPVRLQNAQAEHEQLRQHLDQRQRRLLLDQQRAGEAHDRYKPMHQRMQEASVAELMAERALQQHDAEHIGLDPDGEDQQLINWDRDRLHQRHQAAMLEARAAALAAAPLRQACIAAQLEVIAALDGMEALIARAFIQKLFDEAARSTQLTRYYCAYRSASQNLHSLYFVQYRVLTQNGLWLTQRVGIPDNATLDMRRELLELFVNTEHGLERASFYARAYDSALEAARGAGLAQYQLDEIVLAKATLGYETPSSRHMMFDWLLALEWVARESNYGNSLRGRFVRAQWRELALKSAYSSDLAIHQLPQEFTFVEQWMTLDSASQTYARTEAMASYYIDQLPDAKGQYYWKLRQVAQYLRADVEARLLALSQHRGVQVFRQADTASAFVVFDVGHDSFVGEDNGDGTVLVGVDRYHQVAEGGPWQRIDPPPLASQLTLPECRLAAEQLLSEVATTLARLQAEQVFMRQVYKIDAAEADLHARLRSLHDYYSARPGQAPADLERLGRLAQTLDHLRSVGLLLRTQVFPRAEPRINILHFLHLQQQASYRLITPRQAFVEEPQVYFSQYEVRVGGADGHTWYVTLEYPDLHTPAAAYSIGVINTQAMPLRSTRTELAQAHGEAALRIARSRFGPSGTQGWFPL